MLSNSRVQIKWSLVRSRANSPEWGPHNGWLRQTRNVIGGTIIEKLPNQDVWLVELDNGQGILAFYTDELEVIE